MDELDRLPRELLLATLCIRHDLDPEELADLCQRHALDEETAPPAAIVAAIRSDCAPAPAWTPAGQLALAF